MKASRRGSAFVAALLCAALAGLALAGLASAKELSLYEFEKSFNGSGSNVGAMSSRIEGITVNRQNGHVYVLDQHNNKADITQFDENGNAAFWSALGGTNTLELPSPLYTNSNQRDDILFDNGSGKNLGLFVALVGGFNPGLVRAYNPDGTIRLAGFPLGGIGGICGLGISHEGNVYLGGGQYVSKYDGETGANIAEQKGSFAEQAPCRSLWDNENQGWLVKGQEYTDPECCTYYNDLLNGLFKYRGPTEIGFAYPEFGEQAQIHVQPGVGNSKFKPMQSAAVDEGNDTIFAIEDGKEKAGPAQVLQVSELGQPMISFGAGTIHQSTGIAVNSNNDKVYVASASPTPHVDIFKRNPTPVTVPDATTLSAAHPDGSSATLRAEVDPAGGGTTTDCRFDWGPETKYNFGTLPCKVGGTETNAISSPSEVTNGVNSLTLGTQYHYRVVTRNANGSWSYGPDQLFEASTPPTSTPLLVEKVNTDAGNFTATLNPHGGTTRWRFEIGTEDCSLGGCEVIEAGEGKVKTRLTAEQIQATAHHLQPNTLYHVRLVAENGAGTIEPTLEFRTYPAPPTKDTCPNTRVRQQTQASLLLDCRAYELVTAGNTGGYNVESDLVPLQTPFTAYPDAHDRVLYGLHYGSIPNIAGSPPNYGLDPYVAERTTSGWVTRYVGIPAEGLADSEAYGSPLLSSDEGLSSFAFGGEEICDPCFTGQGTNIPVRRSGGAAEPGMVGDYSGSSEPEGTVLKYLSADGSHLLFGSEHKFAEGGEEGEVNIYSRNLSLGSTELVSTDESGNPISEPGVAGLDQSSDGGRVVVGEDLGDDGAGHPLYALYLHRAGSEGSTALTPGALGGATYDGMTADGSKVFFTTTDQLVAQDEDTSADIYEAEIDSAGNLTLHLMSVKSDGQASNDDGCTPPGSPHSWNAAVGDGKCGAVAFAYGAGVAAGTGTFYFVTPEQLEPGQGEAGQVNLYVLRPGQNPHFVATIDSSATKAPQAPPLHPIANESFATVTGAEALAVDNSTQDLYVVGGAEGNVTRLNGSGGAANFSAGPGAGTNVMSGFTFETPAGGAVAVDNSSSPSDPFKGDLYVTSTSGENAGVSVWAPSGEKLGQINGSGTSVGSFTSACGVAVDEGDGSVYIADKGGYIWRYQPTGSAPITDADYTVTGVHTTSQSPCAVSVQGQNVLASSFAEGPLKSYAKSSFAASPPSLGGAQVNSSARAVSTDAGTGELFDDEGNQIGVFNGAGIKISTIENGGIWSGARGIAVNPTNHHLFLALPSSGKVIELGWELAPYHPIDDPGVLDAVDQPEVHSYWDFQVTPDGNYAAFTSPLALTPYHNNGNSEVYRYDVNSESYECASCGTTLAPAKSGTYLSSFGLNLTDDGRVFFTSREGLVLSDTNEKLDAYQWNGGLVVGKVSTGRSSDDSRLLSVSADGRDAFFFTRDVLVPSDENGGTVKIYDARTEGGYLQDVERLPCAASDECHGPGTPQPGPPNINSITGAGASPAAEGEGQPKNCKKGFVKKHNRCVKKHKNQHRKHARHNQRAGRNG